MISREPTLERIAIAYDNEALNRFQVPSHASEQRHKGVIDDNRAVFGVIDDVSELIGE